MRTRWALLPRKGNAMKQATKAWPEGPDLRRTARRKSSRPPPHLRASATQSPPSAAELAWVVIEVLRAGEHARSLGWCLGALRPGNLTVRQDALVRTESPSRTDRALALLHAQRHRRAGHDPWCGTLGISREHLSRLVRGLKASDGSGILLEVIDGVWEELCATDGQLQETAWELCDFHVREVITPVVWRVSGTSGVRRNDRLR